MRQQAGLDDETLAAVIDTLHAVAERRLDKDRRLELDEKDEFPHELIAEMLGPEVGLHLVYLPFEAGGLDGGARDVFRVSEEMARIDLGVATAFLAIALGIDPIVVGGTDEQRKHWLTRIAEEGLIVAYGVTEPAAGSNVAALKTVADPITDDAGEITGYRLNGTKQFITNGGVAQIYSILAKTPGGPSFFVVERDTPGLSSGPHEEKLGIRASNTTQVILEDVEVPAANLLGGVEGEGLNQANAVFGYTRLMVAAFGLGCGEEALARAVQYSKEREQFGQLLCRRQGYTHKLLVPHAVRLEAARAYCEEVARRLDSGEGKLEVEGAVAKYFATEAGNAAADDAIQAHGGYGYTREYEVEKIRRDVRITTIYEGTSEIQQNIIGMFRWRSCVRSKGGFYRDMAPPLRDLGAAGVEAGAPLAALAAEALAETVMVAHSTKLLKQQWCMFELARLMAEVETAVVLTRKAAAVDRSASSAALLLPAARLHAAHAARQVATAGLALLQGSGRYDNEALQAYREATQWGQIMATSAPLLADLDAVAAEIIGEVGED
jgi:alkylation response protein AidB-like acyl-CoA dehydrogenase